MKIETHNTQCCERRNLPANLPESVLDDNGAHIRQFNVISEIIVELHAGVKLVLTREISPNNKPQPWKKSVEIDDNIGLMSAILYNDVAGMEERVVEVVKFELQKLFDVLQETGL